VGGDSDITVSNNQINGMQHFGIRVFGVRPDKMIHQIRIINNVIRDVEGYGIAVSKINGGHLGDIAIENNQLFECNGGIQVNGAEGTNTIRNNAVTSSSIRKGLLGYYLLNLDSSSTSFSHNTSTNYAISQVPPNVVSRNNILQ
jgi:parallel beta-helix repeat protein